MSTRPSRAPIPGYEASASEVDARNVVTVSGEVDIATAGKLSETLRSELAKGPVVVDLSQVSFMDSTGIRALSDALKEAERKDLQLTIAADIPKRVSDVLRMTGMLEQFPIEA